MKEFNKQVTAKDTRTIEREVELQHIAWTYGFAPQIIDYQINYNQEKDCYVGNIVMEHLDALCIADMYTDDPRKTPKWIWDEIRKIIKSLYYDENIEYVDITGYNFIEKDGKVYIIDFGDAKYVKDGCKPNWFFQDFIDGVNGWNPDYK